MPRNGTNCFELKDGRWRAAWVRRGEKTLYFYGRTMQAALDARAEGKRLASQGLKAKPKRITLSAWMEAWLESHVKPNRKSRTYELKESAYRIHIKPHLGKKYLHELKPLDIEAFYAVKQKEKLAKATLRNLRDTLAPALDLAVKNDEILKNPVRLAEMPSIPETYRITFLEPEQAGLLLKETQKETLSAEGLPKEVHVHGRLLAFMLLTAPRKSEALNAKWEDVTMDGPEPEWRIWGTKTDSAERIVPLIPEAVAILRKEKAAQAQEFLRKGRQQKPEDYIFTGKYGGRMSGATPNNSLWKLTEKLGLPRLRVHELRHSCASLLYDMGMDLKDIQSVLGHKRWQTTSDLYTHLFKRRKRVVMSSMSRLFGERETG